MLQKEWLLAWLGTACCSERPQIQGVGTEFFFFLRFGPACPPLDLVDTLCLAALVIEQSVPLAAPSAELSVACFSVCPSLHQMLAVPSCHLLRRGPHVLSGICSSLTASGPLLTYLENHI